MKALRGRDTLLVGFTLFSMFFGAGNLIFPPGTAAQELEKLLNTLGAEGWELVQKADGFYFFKREKSAPSE